MVTNLTPTTISTPPPPGGDSGFTMDPAAMDTLQQQAGELRTGYEEVSSKLSGQALAGNAFGTAGTFAVEAFNASNTRSVELTGRAASTLGLVGDGLKATAQTHQEADRASGEQFAMVEPATIADGPQGAPAGGPGGTPTPQGPPVTPTREIPGGAGGGAGSAAPPSGAQVPPPTDLPGPDGTTQASNYTAPEASTGQSGTPTGQGGGAPTGQPAGIPTGQVPPTATMPNAPTAESPTKPSTPPQAAAPQAAPIPDFPEIPDPPPVPNGSSSGTTPSANTTPPPTPPIPEVPKDLFKHPGIPDPGTGGGSAGGGTPGGGSPTPTTPGATTPAGGTTPPPMPPIPEAPKDLFKQPGIPDLGTGSGGVGGDHRPGEQSPGDQGGRGDRDASDDERPGRDREGGEHRERGGHGERDDREPGEHGRHGERDQHGEREDRERGEHGGGGGEDGGPGERDQHGFPITSVDGKPCLDLRDLPAEEGERWQENIRDILATKGEGSFFWAGDTIDAQGRRHSLMDLAEFMTNLDSRPEPGSAPDAAGRPGPERGLSDDVAASPARSASGDVYVLVGPNRAEGAPVELADFPTLQTNPRVERVFAIDAVTGLETQIHPKVG